MSLRPYDRAHRRDFLAKSFERAQIGFKVLGGPIASASSEIFQMDINRTPRFGEYFRIWPGAPDNEIEVLDRDSNLRQVVLRVREARRPLVQFVSKLGRTRERIEADVVAAGGRILDETDKNVRVELWTSPQERRYLCGKDDVNYFIAQIAEGSTIREAHLSLRPRRVRESDERCPGRTERQGEWFFIPPTLEEDDRLRALLAKDGRAIKPERPVGARGENRPHVASETVRVDFRPGDRSQARMRQDMFARGIIRHVDHRPLGLAEWRVVVPNREVAPTLPARLRVRWID